MGQEKTRAEDLAANQIDHLGVPLWRASTAFVEAMYSRAAERGFEGYSPADGTILAFLPPTGLTIVQLATRRGASKQATHEAVRKLVARGVLRLDPDPGDKRARRVTFTETGLDFVAALQEIKFDMQAEAEAAIGKDRADRLARDLERLHDLFTRKT